MKEDRKNYIGKVKGTATQVIYAPVDPGSPARGVKKVGGDLRCGKSKG